MKKVLRLVALMFCFCFMFSITSFAEIRLDNAGKEANVGVPEISLRGSAKSVYSLEILYG